ncbi:GAF domain-containing SpoIIE family protein phosphatase [Streptomyces radiopugnans]|uniref:GAF domain-containing SpoIIE family protein phosphatase n=1 Tax=Streptomyces radiopugnans TaxID=403935 RepID=UPI003F193F4C
MCWGGSGNRRETAVPVTENAPPPGHAAVLSRRAAAAGLGAPLPHPGHSARWRVRHHRLPGSPHLRHTDGHRGDRRHRPGVVQSHARTGRSHPDRRDPGLCASAILHGTPYVVPDALTDSRTAANPLVRGEPGIRFYAAAPITTAHGERLGTVNVLDTRPRRPTDDQIAVLEDLAALVMDELELRLSAIRTIAAERAQRTAAIYDPDPCAALTNLDTVLKGEHQSGASRYCTAVFGVLEPAPDGSFTVSLAGGGHPPALAPRADGTVESVSTTGGQLIGILPDSRFVQATTRLLPGETLPLYTDGLTEARAPDCAMLGENGLARRLVTAAPQGVGELLRAVGELLTDPGTGVSDDTALLALSVPPRRTTSPAQENR